MTDIRNLMISKLMLVQFLFLVFSCFMSVNCNSPATPVNHEKDNIQPVVGLPHELKECSGMVEVGKNIFVGLNDGGNKPILFVFTGEKEVATRIVKILGVTNNDWEELADDEDYLYIGDFGNNEGSRRNLMIYKIRKDEVLKLNEVTPEIIHFGYETQITFKKSSQSNFDCEAMTCFGDSLFLFTKNRGNLNTDLYGIPKVPGNYVAKKLDSYKALGLITGADYLKVDSTGELILVGYIVHKSIYDPFLIHFANFKGRDFFGGESKRIVLDRKLQAESVFFHDVHEVCIANEEQKDEKGFIYKTRIPE